jgi:hypothetical protein
MTAVASLIPRNITAISPGPSNGQQLLETAVTRA